MRIMLGLLEGIAKHIKGVTQAGIDVIVEFVKGVTSKLPEVIDAAVKLIVSFIDGLAKAIENNGPTVIKSPEENGA
jgi:phage-related protein